MEVRKNFETQRVKYEKEYNLREIEREGGGEREGERGIKRSMTDGWGKPDNLYCQT